MIPVGLISRLCFSAQQTNNGNKETGLSTNATSKRIFIIASFVAVMLHLFSVLRLPWAIMRIEKSFSLLSISLSLEFQVQFLATCLNVMDTKTICINFLYQAVTTNRQLQVDDPLQKQQLQVHTVGHRQLTAGSCTIESGTSYYSGSITSTSYFSTTGECCQSCLADSTCNYYYYSWSYAHWSYECNLMRGRTGTASSLAYSYTRGYVTRSIAPAPSATSIISLTPIPSTASPTATTTGCTVVSGTDYYDGSYSKISSGDCCTSCITDSTCNYYYFQGNDCYLLNSITGTGSSTWSSYTKGQVVVTKTAASSGCNVVSGTDYYDGIYHKITSNDCCKSCVADSTCNYYYFQGTDCYLLNSITGTKSSWLTSYIKGQVAVTKTAASSGCNVVSGTDYYDGIYHKITSNDCCKSCVADSTCNYYYFQGTDCYLLNSITGTKSSWLTSYIKGQVVVIKTPSSTGCNVASGSDYYNGVVKQITSNDCCASCVADSSCNYYYFQGSDCYLLNAITGTTSSWLYSYVRGQVVVTKAPLTLPPVSSTRQELVCQVDGDSYFYFTGEFTRVTSSDCCAACKSRPTCTNYYFNGNDCYLLDAYTTTMPSLTSYVRGSVVSPSQVTKYNYNCLADLFHDLVKTIIAFFTGGVLGGFITSLVEPWLMEALSPYMSALCDAYYVLLAFALGPVSCSAAILLFVGLCLYCRMYRLGKFLVCLPCLIASLVAFVWVGKLAPLLRNAGFSVYGPGFICHCCALLCYIVSTIYYFRYVKLFCKQNASIVPTNCEQSDKKVQEALLNTDQ